MEKMIEKYKMKAIEDAEWRVIKFHPSPIITVINSKIRIENWKNLIPDCRIETMNGDTDVEKYFPMEVEVRIVYPDNFLDERVEPLGKIYENFYNNLDLLYWDFYPNISKGYKNIKIGTRINGIVSKKYFELNYFDFTPKTFSEYLNNIINFVCENEINYLSEIDEFENKFNLTFP